jgi:hypothetical protein
MNFVLRLAAGAGTCLLVLCGITLYQAESDSCDFSPVASAEKGGSLDFEIERTAFLEEQLACVRHIIALKDQIIKSLAISLCRKSHSQMRERGFMNWRRIHPAPTTQASSLDILAQRSRSATAGKSSTEPSEWTYRTPLTTRRCAHVLRRNSRDNSAAVFNNCNATFRRYLRFRISLWIVFERLGAHSKPGWTLDRMIRAV